MQIRSIEDVKKKKEKRKNTHRDTEQTAAQSQLAPVYTINEIQ